MRDHYIYKPRPQLPKGEGTPSARFVGEEVEVQEYECVGFHSKILEHLLWFIVFAVVAALTLFICTYFGVSPIIRVLASPIAGWVAATYILHPR